MKMSFNEGKKSWSGAIILIIVFCFIIFLPNVRAFSQTAHKIEDDTKNNSAEYNAKRRQYIEMIASVFDYAHKHYVDEIDPTVLYEGAMKGLMDAFGDPHTVYMDATMLRDITDTAVGNFGGVGLTITKMPESTEEEPAFVEVVSPLKGTPGHKAGIQSGDKIISIDGTYTPDITMDEVLSILRGEVGTSVDLVIRRGKDYEFAVTLVRDLIEIQAVEYAMIDEIGYLSLVDFTPQAVIQFQEALDYFAEKNYKGLILDLRGNTGGLLTTAVDIADKFIDSGTIVSTKGRVVHENFSYVATPKLTTVPKGLPVVVLINRMSASASEILAGALKDCHIAYLVGERTFGKGSVQNPIPLPYSDGIKITVAKYYTPSDTNIDGIGIPPDMEVLFPELSEEENEIYKRLMESKVIPTYLEEKSILTEMEIAKFAKKLSNEYPLPENLLRRIIRINIPALNDSVFDLDYDIQLNAALDVLKDVLKNNSFSTLMENSKTLKELQQDVQLEKSENKE